MSIKVSVVIPVYNVEKYLPRCLDSLIEQTLSDIEIICVDDGSTDKSLNILQAYSKKYPNIKIISQNHNSVGYARNVGVKNAVGDYIGYVDADDFAKPDFLEKMYAAAVANDADIVLTNFYIYRNDTSQTYAYRDMVLIHRLSELGVFKASQYPDVLLNFGCWDKLYKHDFLTRNAIAFPENRIYEDFKYSYDSLVRAERIVVLPDRLYYYRKNAGKSITDQETRNNSFKFDFLKNISEIRTEWTRNPEFEKYFRSPVVYLQIHDGCFHNSNILNKRIFRKFFLSMSSMFDKTDAEIIRKLKNEKFIEYTNYLLNGDWENCYRMFRKN